MPIEGEISKRIKEIGKTLPKCPFCNKKLHVQTNLRPRPGQNKYTIACDGDDNNSSHDMSTEYRTPDLAVAAFMRRIKGISDQGNRGMALDSESPTPTSRDVPPG